VVAAAGDAALLCALDDAGPALSPPLLNALSSATLAAAAAVEAALLRQPDSPALAAALCVAHCALAALQRRAAHRLASLQQRLGVCSTGTGRGASSSADASGSLAARLSGAAGEADALRMACAALRALFPTACAQAVAVLQSGGSVVRMEAAARTEAARQALLLALPCALPPPGAAGAGTATSVSFVCSGTPGSAVITADSVDCPAGTRAFTDWAAALDGGLSDAARLLTARLVSGNATVGFVVLAFPAVRAFAAHDTLRDFCTAVGASLLEHRAKDAATRAVAAHTSSLASAARDTETAVSEGLALASDVFPQHIVGAMAARARKRAFRESSGMRSSSTPLPEGTPEDLMTDSYDCGARASWCCASCAPPLLC
jgi:hypothetical protein